MIVLYHKKYTSTRDFSNLTAYAGTLYCFNKEAVKAIMLEGDTVKKEESQEIADSKRHKYEF